MGIEFMTYRCVVNALNHCATLLSNNFGRESINEIILDFIVSSLGNLKKVVLLVLQRWIHPL